MANANHRTLQAQPEKSFRVATNMRLARLELSKTDLATKIGKARNTVSMVINHPTLMPGVQTLINEALTAMEEERGLGPL